MSGVVLPITPTRQQAGAIRGLREAIGEYGAGVLTAETGVGKTVMSLAIFLELQEENKRYNDLETIIMLVAPAAILDKGQHNGSYISPWYRELSKFGIPLDKFLPVSYESIRGGAKMSDMQRDQIISLALETGETNLFESPPNATGQGRLEGESYDYGTFKWADSRAHSTGNGKSERDVHGWVGDHTTVAKNLVQEGLFYQFVVDQYTSIDGWVIRKDYEEISDGPKGKIAKKKSSFSPSLQCMEFFRTHNVLLVGDEIHNAKTESSAQSKSFAAVVRALNRAKEMNKKNRSGLLLLTATPAEKEEHLIGYMRILGMEDPIRNNDMILSKWSQYKSYLVARRFDKSLAKKIAFSSNVIDALGYEIVPKRGGARDGKREKMKGVGETNAKLYLECVSVKIQFTVTNIYKKQAWNAFLNITSRAGQFALDEAAEVLKRLASNKDKDMNMSLLGKLVVYIEKSVVDAIIDEAIYRLRSDPTNQVLIGFRHVSNVRAAIERIEKEISDGDPLFVGRISGVLQLTEYEIYESKYHDLISQGFDRNTAETTAMNTVKKITKTRAKKPSGLQGYGSHDPDDPAIKKYADTTDPYNKYTPDELKMKYAEAHANFQSGRTRVVVGTLPMISQGKDMHDTVGGRQRWSYVPGDYWLTQFIQFAGRTARMHSKTIPQIFVCYPRTLGPAALGVYTSMINKSNLMKKSLTKVNTKYMSQSDIEEMHASIKMPNEYNVYLQLPNRDSIWSFSLSKAIHDTRNNRYIPDPEVWPIKEIQLADKLTLIENANKEDVEYLDGQYSFFPIRPNM